MVIIVRFCRSPESQVYDRINLVADQYYNRNPIRSQRMASLQETSLFQDQ